MYHQQVITNVYMYESGLIRLNLAGCACAWGSQWHLHHWYRVPRAVLHASSLAEACGMLKAGCCSIGYHWQQPCVTYLELLSNVPLLRRSNLRISAAYECLSYHSPHKSPSRGHPPAVEPVIRRIAYADVYMVGIWQPFSICTPVFTGSYGGCCCRRPSEILCPMHESESAV